MFGSRRSRETNPIDAVRLSETSPIKFVRIRPRESKPRSKFVWVQKAKGNESYMYVGAVRLSETSPNKFWRNQAEGK